MPCVPPVTQLSWPVCRKYNVLSRNGSTRKVKRGIFNDLATTNATVGMASSLHEERATMANPTPLNTKTISYSNTTALGGRSAAVLHHAVDDLRHAREMAWRNLQVAIAGFREIFVNVPAEGRSGPLLRQAWAVHQALEVLRSLEGALAHLQPEARAPEKSMAA